MPQNNISHELPENIINIYRVYLHKGYLRVCTTLVCIHLLDPIRFLVLTQKIFTSYFN